MKASALAVLIVIAGSGFIPTGTSSEGGTRAEARAGQGVVDLFGEEYVEDGGWRAGSPRQGRPTEQTRSTGGGEAADSTVSRCIPRVRVLDGVEQRGWACPDGSAPPDEVGGSLWVPEGEGGDARAPTVDQVVLTREDVQSLLVDPGGVDIQPDRSWVLVNAETIAFTDAAEHVLTTEVLGRAVEVRVVPVEFSWDFGDGSTPITGTHPGAPWPDHTVAHSYGSPGPAQVTLRTEWDAHFRVEGESSWTPVTGRPVTVSTSAPFEVVTATPRLVRGAQG